MGFLGTYLGKSLGTALGGDMASAELSRLESYLAKNLFSWLRADSRVEAASKVTQFTDKVALAAEGAAFANARSVSSSHALAQASGTFQVPAVAADATLSGRDSATFAGTFLYESTIAGANWAFRHDGSAVDEIHVYVPTSASTSVVVGTRLGNAFAEVGSQILSATGSGGTRLLVGDGIAVSGVTSPIDTGYAGANAVNAPTYVNAQYKESDSPEFALRLRNVTAASGASNVAPVATAPQLTLRLGAAVAAANMRWADSLIANRVDATLHAAMLRYVALRYPVLA